MNGETDTTRHLEGQICKVAELLAKLDELAEQTALHEIALPAEIDDLVERMRDLESPENGVVVHVLTALRG